MASSMWPPGQDHPHPMTNQLVDLVQLQRRQRERERERERGRPLPAGSKTAALLVSSLGLLTKFIFVSINLPFNG